jgi:hypothetical protein
MPSYRVARNAPGPVNLVIVHPDFSAPQTYAYIDFDATIARDIAKLYDTSTDWDPVQADNARKRLYVRLPVGGSIQSNSPNLTVTAL